MSIGHDYIALLLVQERAQRMQQEAARNRTSRVVRSRSRPRARSRLRLGSGLGSRSRPGRRSGKRPAAPVLPLQRDGSVSSLSAVRGEATVERSGRATS